MTSIEVEYLCGCKGPMGCDPGREVETFAFCFKMLCPQHAFKTPTPHLLILTRASPEQQRQHVEDLSALHTKFKQPDPPGELLRVGGEITSNCRKCKKDTNHVIHAIAGNQAARVECFVCHATHKFFAPTGKV